MSRAFQRAANSLFQVSLPSPFRISASPLKPQPAIHFPLISMPPQLYRILSSLGKLTWKSEFAARWKALDIRFEAYGKDIADSVRINDRICREVLCFEPPSHAKYEMFLDKGGKKISKSTGNVFTPQVWFNYGSPQSLLLLMLKRFVGTRSLDVSDIPAYMNEIDSLEDVYFGKKQVSEKEGTKLKGLYLYCYVMKPPAKPNIHVPYNLMAFLVKMAPKECINDYIKEKLQS